MARGTRDRILTEAMRLFGEQGFDSTSVAQIEQAAGLRSGSGGLYRHFASKDALLSAGIRERIEARQDLLPTTAPAPHTPVHSVLLEVARTGLKRLDHDRDVNRILVRDLKAAPELLEFLRDSEIRANHEALTQLLENIGGDSIDAEAVAAVLIDAVSHYWLLKDVFGGDSPIDVDEDRYLTTLATMTTALIGEVP